MFYIDDKYKVRTNIPVIHDNYNILHYDEYPVLYTGTNLFGNRIVGSVMIENEEDDSFRHINIVITDKQYSSFITKQTSYKDLILGTEYCFIVDKDINELTNSIFNIKTSDIPEDYLPLPEIFCPEIEHIAGYEFAVSLKGKLADVHEAIISTVSRIATQTEQFLQRLLDTIQLPEINAKMHQYIPTQGSFRVNIRIRYKTQNLFFQPRLANKYIASCIDYSINDLPSDVEGMLTGESLSPNFIKKVEEPLKELLTSSVKPFGNDTRNDIIEKLLQVPSDLEKISEHLGEGFEYLEFISSGMSGREDLTLADIDDVTAQSISYAAELVENNSKDEVEEDDVYKNYKIQIYSLNTTTRKGSAHIYYSEEEGLMDKPSIRIEGESAIEGSTFSESLHMSKWIMVRAKSKKVKGRYRYLTIESK